MSRRCGFPPFGATPSLRKSTVFYHKVTAILILFQLAIAICDYKIYACSSVIMVSSLPI